MEKEEKTYVEDIDRSIYDIKDEEKDAISHRGKALRLFCEKLKEHQVKNA